MKLLNIEDSEADHQLILHHLKKGGVRDIIARRVETEDELHEALKEKWSVVISDYNIPGIDPQFALSLVRSYSKFTPFIVVSGLVGEESVVEMMKAGVQDFVIKSRLERLGPVVKRSLREVAVLEQEAKSRTIAKRAMAAKEEMLAIVYHDIKNPIAAIQLDAQLLDLLAQKEISKETLHDVRIQAKRILRTVDRLKGLVTDLLEHNNPYQETDHETFVIRKSSYNPVQLINDVLDGYRPLVQEKNISIKKTIHQKKMHAFLDKDRIHQVLSNILSNALKFTPYDGEILIEMKENELGDCCFSVADNGPGIPEQDASKIFEKFWTGGTGNGLGLYICKSIIEAHGGKIIAEKSETGGARFTFTIPQGIPCDSSIANQIEVTPKRNEIIKTIYLVDDDHDLREVISWALEKEGYRVLSYENPQNALDELDHTFYPPDLIVLDFHMGTMKGNEFLERKSSSGEDFVTVCPVIMLSASPEAVKSSTDSSLYTDILIKPVDLNQLLKTIKRYL